MPSPRLNLAALLHDLRAAGLRVGPCEEARLRHLFSIRLAQSKTELQQMLTAVLVKARGQQAALDRAFDAWWARAEVVGKARRAPVAIKPAPPVAPSPSKMRWPLWMALAAVVVLVGLGITLWPNDAPLPPPPTHDAATLGGGDASPTAVKPLMRPSHFDAWVPVIETMPTVRWRPGLLALAPLLLAAGLWFLLRRRRWLASASNRPVVAGPLRIYPRGGAPRGVGLLTRTEAQTAIYGVGHFEAGLSPRNIDIRGTVNATARAAGRPELRFERERHARSVWLWLDDSTRARAQKGYADALQSALDDAGMVTARAWFHALPGRLYADDPDRVGEFAPGDVDDHRYAAEVLVFTDGRRLAARSERAGDDRQIRALLRSLASWPHLAFVDFGRGAHGLASLLAPYGLTVIDPDQVPTHLAGRRHRARAVPPGRPLCGDLRVWAGACALAPFPVDEGSALLVGRKLSLAISPWSAPRLRADADQPGDRIAWSPPARVERIETLREADPTLLAQAVEHWIKICDVENRRRRQDPRWPGTAAEARLRVDRALLALWRGHPVDATTRALYADFQAGFEGVISRELAWRVPADWAPARHCAQMPWRFDDQLPETRSMLVAMDLGRRGGRQWVEQLQRPGRQWIGVGALAGLALAGALSWLWADPVDPLEKPSVEISAPAQRIPAWYDAREQGERQWSVGVATPKSRKRTGDIEAGASVGVRWTRRAEPCRDELGDGTVRYRCGMRPSLPRVEDWPDRSLFYLVGAENEAQWQADIDALLDSGCADAVFRLSGSALTKEVSDPLWPHPKRQQQVVVVAAGKTHSIAGVDAVVSAEPGAWVKALRFDGVRPLSALSDVRIIEDRGARCVGLPPQSGVVAWIEAPEGSNDARALAKRLRATQSVTRVLVAPRAMTQTAWSELRQAGVGKARGKSLLMVLAGALDDTVRQRMATWPGHAVAVQSDDLAGLTDALHAYGELTLDHVWPEAKVVAGEPDTLMLRGTNTCPRRETTMNGMRFVRVCAGTFRMGTTDEELAWAEKEVGKPDWWEDDYTSWEQPAHQVRVRAFWMGKHEVSNRQLGRPGVADDRLDYPVVNVTWTEADAFCRRHDHQLPLEVQWEYAARGPESLIFPWGNQKPTPSLAIFGSASPLGKVDSLPDVGSPFGTQHQADNAYEWVADCFQADAYQDAPARRGLDPSNRPKSCEIRVARGGAFGVGAWVLRSADRFRVRPVNSFGGLGFRCVRGPRRQPGG